MALLQTLGWMLSISFKDQGEISKVHAWQNFFQEPFKVSVGDRIAQLILERISMASLEEVPCLEETQRGQDGFGSTGKK